MVGDALTKEHQDFVRQPEPNLNPKQMCVCLWLSPRKSHTILYFENECKREERDESEYMRSGYI